jgi:fructokinase
MNDRSKAEIRQARPLIFGEVLFDVFPDGSRILGGAPFNVAWHLQGLGLDPLFISRVGDDAAGERVRTAMRDWGMDASGVQRDRQYPTGMVRVRLERGQPDFEILDAQAYDRIDTDEALRAAGEAGIGLVYHGTLALRDPRSRAALHALDGVLCVPRCVDLNLRAPWWSAESAAGVLHGARWLKLNDVELRAIGGGESVDDADLIAQAERLRERLEIDVLLLTLGERGAIVVAEDGAIESPAHPVAHFVDAVGAGDAFAAVALAGAAAGWSLPLTLARALEFAAWICGLRGAVAADRERYARYRKAWGLAAGDTD